MEYSKWYLKASFLGLVFFIAILWVRPVGVSTQYSVLSGMIQTSIEPETIWEDTESTNGYRSENAYYDSNDGKIAKSIMQPVNYDMIFVFSIPIGALIGYCINQRLHKKKRREWLEYKKRQGGEDSLAVEHNSFVGYFIYFISGFLLLFGARMADGCTSGHMMSGIMQGSVSGYLFAAVVFVLAIPTAILTRKLWEREG